MNIALSSFPWRFLPLVLLLCASFVATAQRTDPAAATEVFDDGVVAMLAGKRPKAAKLFRKATKLNPTFTPAYRLLGVVEELNGEYAAAAAAYEEVIRQDTVFSRLIYYQLGKVYYRMSQPKKAYDYLARFEELQARDLGDYGRNGEEERPEELRVLETLSRDLDAARITQDSNNFINVTEVINVGAPINTARNDYFPFFANDLRSLIYTRQGEFGDEDLIQGRRKDLTGGFTTERFGSFNTLQPEGMCTLVRDGERIYFTLCHEETSRGGCDLYAGWLIDGKIQLVEPLPDYINDVSWESQPAISCDGQQLFFASIRPGGLGGSDIYVCHKQEDGTWGEPQNLGDGVNTPLDEEGPFLSNDGKTLYFSSMGHLSLGDQDIYMSWWDDITGRFTRAINLGPPVNGPHRELGFHLTSDGRTGYFASDRPGGRGGLDIYRFELSDHLTSRPMTYVAGYVTDSVSGTPITDQAVPVRDGATYYTNFAGRFFICAPAGEPLPLRADHPEYLPYKRTFAIPEWENRTTYRIDLTLRREQDPPPPPPLATIPPPPAPATAPPPEPPPAVDPEPVVADTIRRKARVVKRNLTVRFSFDDASLTAAQIANIEAFAESVKDKSIVSIVIHGFADDIGAENHNLILSQKRAKAVSVHLATQGVRANEVTIKGLGELPGASQRALNRKVEVTVRYREMVPIR